MSVIYWVSDGGGAGVGNIPTILNRWIITQGNASLIVNGGDIYSDGKPAEFDVFKQQMDGNLSLHCETPGNHDWRTFTESPSTGRIPSGYEAFWSALAPPLSKQPIDKTKKGGARYEHFIDLDGWRLIFLDTGRSGSVAWPAGDESRRTWLRSALQNGGGRARIVFAHHSKLSLGLHGDNSGVNAIWQELFDATGAPLAVCTLAGHDHSVSLYGPRPKTSPESGSVAFAKGIHVMVNGAGGAGHYQQLHGTVPDLLANNDDFCLTRITLQNPHSAFFEILSFGTLPRATTTPTVIGSFTASI